MPWQATPGSLARLYSRALRQADRQAMKLRDVNTTDIGSAIRAGCRTMASVFNADDNDVPFFGSQVWPDPHMAFSSVHDESHVPGRHPQRAADGGIPGIPNR